MGATRTAIDLVKLGLCGALLWGMVKAWWLDSDVHARYAADGTVFTLAPGQPEVEVCDYGRSLYRDPYSRPHCEKLEVVIQDDDNFTLSTKDKSSASAFRRVGNREWKATPGPVAGGRWDGETD